MSFFAGMARAKQDADERNHDKEMLDIQFQQKLELQRREHAHARGMAAAKARSSRGGGSRGGGSRGGGSSLSKDEKKRVEAILALQGAGVSDSNLAAIDYTGQSEKLAKTVKDSDDSVALVAALNKKVTEQVETHRAGDVNGAVARVTDNLDKMGSGAFVEGVASGVDFERPITEEESTFDNEAYNPMIPMDEGRGIPDTPYPTTLDLNARIASRIESSSMSDDIKEEVAPLFPDVITYNKDGFGIGYTFDNTEMAKLFGQTTDRLTNIAIDRFESGESFNNASNSVMEDFYALYEAGGGEAGLPSMPERVNILQEYGVIVSPDEDSGYVVASTGESFIPGQTVRGDDPFLTVSGDDSFLNAESSVTPPATVTPVEPVEAVTPEVKGTPEVVVPSIPPSNAQPGGDFTGTGMATVVDPGIGYTSPTDGRIWTNEGWFNDPSFEPNIEDSTSSVGLPPSPPLMSASGLKPEPQVTVNAPPGVVAPTVAAAPSPVVGTPAPVVPAAPVQPEPVADPLNISEVYMIDPSDPESVLNMKSDTLGLYWDGQAMSYWRRGDNGLEEIDFNPSIVDSSSPESTNDVPIGEYALGVNDGELYRRGSMGLVSVPIRKTPLPVPADPAVTVGSEGRTSTRNLYSSTATPLAGDPWWDDGLLDVAKPAVDAVRPLITGRPTVGSSGRPRGDYTPVESDPWYKAPDAPIKPRVPIFDPSKR